VQPAIKKLLKSSLAFFFTLVRNKEIKLGRAAREHKRKCPGNNRYWERTETIEIAEVI